LLQKINGRPSAACKLLKDAQYPALFPTTLEFSPPARGTWNIVHTGMQLPESHQIYICASGCVRGVVLTAAEMGAMDRFSTIEIHEEDLVDKDNEAFLIEGISDILARLPKLPRAVFVFPACVHHFLGVNFHYVYRVLRERWPQIDFLECFMDPIRQTRSITPEQRERREIYRQLRPRPLNPKAANILGSNLPTDPDSELVHLFSDNGWILRDMTTCRTYDEFLEMGEGSLDLWYNPFGGPAAENDAKRRGATALYIGQPWRFPEIKDSLNAVCRAMHFPASDWSDSIGRAKQALARAKAVIGDTPVAIDYAAVFRPFSLARLLVESGFHVAKIYADSCMPDDADDFRWLQENAGDIELWATKNPDMRLMRRGTGKGPLLAIGQKAAYFNQTKHFVNLIEGNGLYGFTGIEKLAGQMTDAFLHEKPIEENIRTKGLGGPCCLC